LIANPAQRWFSDVPSKEDLRPDAWCEECKELFNEQGEWNERNEPRLRIKLIYHQCYKQLRPAE
ncbi:MAG TPA: hypothetical protein VLL05_13775, partial [Terriglobales bacterium]|nr:hypothetical protein [Terriglobales bacterium]